LVYKRGGKNKETFFNLRFGTLITFGFKPKNFPKVYRKGGTYYSSQRLKIFFPNRVKGKKTQEGPEKFQRVKDGNIKGFGGFWAGYRSLEIWKGRPGLLD